MDIVSVEYGLAPEYKFSESSKCCYFDCYTATLAYLQEHHIKNYSFCGDSAGGQLCTAVALKFSEMQAANQMHEIPAPEMLIECYPGNGGINLYTENAKNNSNTALSYEFCSMFKSAYVGGPLHYQLIDKSFKTTSMERNFGILKAMDQLDGLKCIHSEGQEKFTLQDLLKMEHCQHLDINSLDTSEFQNFTPKMRDTNIQIFKSTYNKYVSPTIASDAEFTRLLDYLKIGIVTVKSEYDILADSCDSFIEKLERCNQSNKIIKKYTVEGGLHGFVTWACDYPKFYPEYNKIIEDICSDITEFLN